MSVQQYTFVEYCPDRDTAYMAKDNYGDYVLYEDYENLENDFKILQRDYAEMVRKLNDIVVMA